MQRDESLARSNEIDEICDSFEQQLLAGELRTIEDILAENTSSDVSRLLCGLLLVELKVRNQNGESPSADEYLTRFPEQTDVIDKALQTLATRADDPQHAETVDVSFQSADETDETYVPGDPNVAETIVPGAGTKPDLVSSGDPRVKHFGDYELLYEIARGGMGVVYKARQTKLNRVVALKMIKAGELAGEEEIQRFHAEAEAAAQLDHPGIVPIYEVGEQNGLHFFSMGFVDGVGLDSRLKDGPLPPRDAAELIRTIAEAVQYAHDKGIVHRDLKPANVLLANDAKPTEPGCAGSGHNGSRPTAEESREHAARAGTVRLYSARITDFGLAKNILGDSGMTATGQILGTPSYMPPEQAAGKVDEIGPLADVYSLGAMLYATLTGRPPFQAANVMETLKQVLQREPVSPRQLNPAVDHDLETICLKCLEKDAAQRYADARGLANDLESYLAGKPISARPISRPARLWRWCKRNPLGATVAGLLLFLAIAGPAVAGYQIETNRRLDAALAGEKDATATARRKEEETSAALARVKEALDNEQAALKRKDKALRETEKSIDAYVEVVENAKLLREPRFKPLLKMLLADALAHYERYIAEHQHEHDEATRTRLTRALERIAVISQVHGSQKDAIVAYQRMLKTAEPLAREFPRVAKYRLHVAAAYNNLGVAFRDSAKLADAQTAFQRASKAFARLQHENPAEPKYVNSLARAHLNIGEVHRLNAQPAQALSEFRRAIQISEQQTRDHADVAESWSVLALGHFNIGRLLRGSRKPVEALAAHRRALKIRQRLAQDHPKAARIQFRLSESFASVGSLSLEVNKPAAAIAAFQQALKIQEDLAAANPTLEEYQLGLADSLMHLGLAYRRSHREADSLAATQRSVDIQERLIRSNPNVSIFRIRHAGNLVNLSSILRQSDSQKALSLLARAIDGLTIVRKSEPNNPTARLFLRNAHSMRARIYNAQARHDEAVAELRTTLQLDTGVARLHLTRRLMRTLAAADEHEEAFRVQASLQRIVGQPGAVRTLYEVYNLACDFLFAASQAERDSRLTRAEHRKYTQGARHYALRLLSTLSGRNFFRGPTERQLLIEDPRLNSLRRFGEFRKIAGSVGVDLPAWAVRPRSAELGGRCAGSAKSMQSSVHRLGNEISTPGVLKARVLRQIDRYDRAETAF